MYLSWHDVLLVVISVLLALLLSPIGEWTRDRARQQWAMWQIIDEHETRVRKKLQSTLTNIKGRIKNLLEEACLQDRNRFKLQVQESFGFNDSILLRVVYADACANVLLEVALACDYSRDQVRVGVTKPVLIPEPLELVCTKDPNDEALVRFLSTLRVTMGHLLQHLRDESLRAK